MTILEVQNLFKEFDGIKAVEGLSLEVKENSILSVVGPNGSGKTTLFNLITGFSRADKGKIIFEGKNLTFLSPYKIARLGIGRTFQNIRLFPQISVLDNIMLALKYEKGENFFHSLFQTKRMKREEMENLKKAEEILKFVGLLEKKEELAENLSHGQRKLLELARVLALNPKLLLLDEPFAGVFPETRKRIVDLFRTLKDQGKTIVFIEHNINLVWDVAERIVVLNYGKKIAEGTPEEIKGNKEVQKIYLGKENENT
jgi:ABC-type branched-subunit amino acid transport system ATPase component